MYVLYCISDKSNPYIGIQGITYLFYLSFLIVYFSAISIHFLHKVKKVHLLWEAFPGCSGHTETSLPNSTAQQDSSLAPLRGLKIQLPYVTIYLE